ncbi:leucine-rich repeat domain-containing protein [Priestia megaterium]|uniref:leucine-rich repeat domain-containing protein n=1 Tax=Priestia megaterium TaxID=1404 RepID=UPI0025AEF614|nr:leucine-rich repeat domain-containing protein [Priestia megaterium]MDN3232881.1 leucine-rich repeat domain-containing protein [Priestia megaterium]
MNLEKEHVVYVFHDNKRPDITYDLKNVETSAIELLIRGDTKNLLKLTELSGVKKLWIEFVNQKEFDKIINLINPESLYIYGMRVEDLSGLENLTNLRILGLESNTRAQELWDLKANPLLESLLIRGFSKLTNIQYLKYGSNLKILNLEGNDSNQLKIENLQPLKSLQNLEYLAFSNISVMDESLEPISALKGLEIFKTSNQFPTEEFAMLSVLLPNTHCNKFEPYFKLTYPIYELNTMVVGKRKPLLNYQRDKEKLDKYERTFRKMQEKYLSKIKNKDE